ncbi:hypothetical protein [Deinococcus altitudinis]|uniref:hypothetical protein n=1 Tax=Deinococcus altitudinis TaxID=468914 RepID=UPI0038929F91
MTLRPMTTDREEIVSVRPSGSEGRHLADANGSLGRRVSPFLQLATIEKAGRQ